MSTINHNHVDFQRESKVSCVLTQNEATSGHH
jgi:hypothetical protein